ncbi:unnamed protein product [Parnassius mnemosyne]|uniref:BED-type domain-containing protein n=1 Tax=Parnassius mnemosyne TaxID=213953 RepID=A0AAV1LXL5_9NEOP
MKRSKLWSYFKKEGDGNVICTICNKRVKTSGNTSNLASHMKHKHPEDCDVDDKSLDKSQRKLTECGGTSSSLSRSAGVSVNLQTSDESAKPPETSVDTVEASCSSAVVVFPTTKPATPNTSANTPKIKQAFENVYQYSKVGAKYDRITDAIAYFIAVDNRPFYAVEGKGFRHLIKELAPLYKVPCRETIKAKIDKKYDTLSKFVADKLKNVDYFSLTTDIWTETLTNTGYLGLTVHFLQQNELQSVTIGVFELEESNNGEYIGQQLTGILRSWNIDTEKVMAFVTDSGANMVKAIRETFGAHKHIPCFAHMINRVAEEAIRKTSGLSDIIEHVRNIVKYVKKRQDMTLELKRKQIESKIPDEKALKVILDVKTRWNSMYYMLERFLDLAPYISDIIFCKIDAPTMLTAVQLNTIKDVAYVMRPLEAMTREASAERYVTVSKIVPMVSCAIDQYKELGVTSTIADELKRNITLEIEKRFGHLEYNMLLAVSTLLDPRFKSLHFKKPEACVKAMSRIRKFISEYKSAVTASSTSSEDEEKVEFDFWKYHKSLAHTQIKRKKLTVTMNSRYISLPL